VRYALHPEADEELAEAVRYYAAIDAELGIRFYREIERLMFEVCAHPQRFRRFDPPARRHFSHSFPMLSSIWMNPTASGSSPSYT
jgi:hypothetical protein